MNAKRHFLCVALATVVLSGCAWASAPALDFASPRGGEVFVVGQKQFVKLASKFKSIVVELSRDGGGTFEALGTIDNTVKDATKHNVLSFTVSAPATANGVIRATGKAKNDVVIVSGTFSIVTSLAGSAGLGDGSVLTANLADKAVTTAKLADKAVTDVKVGSGTASSGMLLTADGAGGAAFASFPANLNVSVSGSASSITSPLAGDVTGPQTATVVSTVGGVTAANVASGANAANAATAANTANTIVKRDASGNFSAGAVSTGGVTVTNTVPKLSLVTTGSSFDFQIDGNGLRVLRNFGVNSTPIFTCNPTNNDVRVGGNGAINLDGVGSVRIDGSFSLEANTFTNDFTANDATCVFFCNATNNAITITLPAASGRNGRIYLIKKVLGANAVTIACPAGVTIEGAASVPLAAINDFRLLICNGSNYFVISK